MKKKYKINLDGTLSEYVGTKPPTEYALYKEHFSTKSDGNLYTYYKIDGTPDLVKEQADIDAKAYSDWKASRQLAVDTIEVTYGNVVYQGDEKSQDRMSRAINGLPDDVATINWTAKDNTSVALNRIQLRELLGLCGAEQSILWNLGRP